MWIPPLICSYAADNKLMIFFKKKIGFNISCKLSPLILVKKIRKIFQNVVCSVLKVFTQNAKVLKEHRAGLCGSVGCAVRLETRRSRVQHLSWRLATFFLSHLLVAGCDIGVRFSVRLSTFMSTFDICVKVSILINYKTKQPSNLA